MTGKRFEAPRPDWNILKRLGQLADGFDVDRSPLHAGSNPSPVEASPGPADYCIGKSEASPARPTSVRTAPIRDRVLGCDYVIGGARSDEVRQGQTNNSGFSGAARHKSRHTGGGR